MPRPHLTRAAVMVLLCVLAPGELCAQAQGSAASPGEPTAAAHDVDALIAQGVALRERGDDEDALATFRQAWTLSHGARAEAQMALAEQALGSWADAEAHLRHALAAAEDPWIAANRAALESALATIGEHMGNLVVRGGVVGAELWVNGQRIGPLPMTRPARVVAGIARVEVRAPGYYRAEREARVVAGQTTRETIDLVALPQPEAAPASGPASPQVPFGVSRPPVNPALFYLAGGSGWPFRFRLNGGGYFATGLPGLVAWGPHGTVIIDQNGDTFEDDVLGVAVGIGLRFSELNAGLVSWTTLQLTTMLAGSGKFRPRGRDQRGPGYFFEGIAETHLAFRIAPLFRILLIAQVSFLGQPDWSIYQPGVAGQLGIEIGSSFARSP